MRWCVYSTRLTKSEREEERKEERVKRCKGKRRRGEEEEREALVEERIWGMTEWGECRAGCLEW